jgi:hypothetical protein
MSHATLTPRLYGLCPISACVIAAGGSSPHAGLSEQRADVCQGAVLQHIRLAHPSLFADLTAVNLGLLVESGASTFEAASEAKRRRLRHA